MMNREGLTLTRCDVCGCRQWCAVNGTAMCERCCPGAVDAARKDAAEARQERQAVLDAAWMDEALPPSEDDPVGEPVAFKDVAHILFPEWYSRPLAA
jgi:hypothetical protein